MVQQRIHYVFGMLCLIVLYIRVNTTILLYWQLEIIMIIKCFIHCELYIRQVFKHTFIDRPGLIRRGVN